MNGQVCRRRRYDDGVARPFGQILLLTGNAEYLIERTRRRAITALHESDPDCQINEVSAGDLGAGELATAMSPSLFSDASAVVVDSIQDLDEAPQAELLSFAAEPSPEVATILIHDGGNKGRGLVDKLRALASVTEIKNKAPAHVGEYVTWVRTEIREAGRGIDHDAADALVRSVGHDLRALAGAADQLVMSSQGNIDVATVRQYFGGRAEVRGYEIADAAISGRIDVALENLRWAEANNVAEVLILSAIASALRSLTSLKTAPAGMRDGELAKYAGVPPFKLRSLREQARAWSVAALERAIADAAKADIEIKGGGSDPSFALERLVLQIATARSKH